MSNDLSIEQIMKNMADFVRYSKALADGYKEQSEFSDMIAAEYLEITEGMEKMFSEIEGAGEEIPKNISDYFENQRKKSEAIRTFVKINADVNTALQPVLKYINETADRAKNALSQAATS